MDMVCANAMMRWLTKDTQELHADGFARGPPRGYQGNVLNGRPQNIPQQAFTNTGLIMPNFGMPFGNFPAPSMQTASHSLV